MTQTTTIPSAPPLVSIDFQDIGSLIGEHLPYDAVPGSARMPVLTNVRVNHLPNGSDSDVVNVDAMGDLAAYQDGNLLKLTVAGQPEMVEPMAAVYKGTVVPSEVGAPPHPTEFKLTFTDAAGAKSPEYRITKVLRIPYTYKIEVGDGTRDVFADIFVLYNGSGHL
jgi:hypothetical protein